MKQNNAIWNSTFIKITIANFCLFMGFQMLLPTLPLYAQSLGANDSLIGLISGVFTISNLLARPFTGLLLDQKNKKTILIIGLVIMIILTMSFHIASTIILILTFRFIQGLGWSFSQSATSTIASSTLDKKNLGEGMGYFSFSNSLAMALAPPLSLYLVSQKGFGTLFNSATLFLLAVFLFIINLKVEKRPINSVSKKPFEKEVVFPSLLMLLCTIIYGALLSFVVLYGNEKGITNLGLFFTLNALCLIIFRPMIGKIADKHGFFHIVIIGSLLTIFSMIVITLASSLAHFLIASILYGSGFSALQASFQTLTLMSAPEGRLGAANSTFFMGFDGGIGIGSIYGGVLSSLWGYQLMFLSCIAFPLLIIVLYVWQRKNDRIKIK